MIAQKKAALTAPPMGLHGGPDGIHAPGCNGPRARYHVHGLAAAEFVEVLLRCLGFKGDHVREIMEAIAADRAPHSAPTARGWPLT